MITYPTVRQFRLIIATSEKRHYHTLLLEPFYEWKNVWTEAEKAAKKHNGPVLIVEILGEVTPDAV